MKPRRPLIYPDRRQEAIEALALLCRTDIRIARNIIATHSPMPGGRCSHQGATREVFRWPCWMVAGANQAIAWLAQHPEVPRPRPPSGGQTLKKVDPNAVERLHPGSPHGDRRPGHVGSTASDSGVSANGVGAVPRPARPLPRRP